MRAVFDTNVLVSAFLAEGLCAKLLVRANRREFTLLTGSVLLAEFEAVLRGKMGASESHLREAVALLREISEFVEKAEWPARRLPGLRDPDDEAVWGFAVSVRADILVTGDRDFLDLKSPRRPRIISPRDFERLFF